MTTKFTIEISGYPQDFVIAAESEGEAILEAQKRWHDQQRGSIYETKVTEREEIKDFHL